MNNKVPYWYYIVALYLPLTGAVGFVLSKYIIDDISPIQFLFYRWVIAFIVFTPFAIRSFIKELQIIKANWKILSIISLSGVTLFHIFAYYSVKHTTSTNSSIVVDIFPIFVLFLGVFVNKDKLDKIQLLSIILASIGAIVIISHGHILEGVENLFHNIGDFIALIAAMFFAIYIFATKFKPANLSFYSFVYATFLIGIIAFLPIYLFDIFYLENTLNFDLQTIVSLCVLAFGINVIGTITMNFSILNIGPNITSILFYLTPVFTALIAVMVLDEKFEYFHIVGMSFIIFGINLPIITKRLGY